MGAYNPHLRELLEHYGENKDTMDSIKKLVDADNTSIKELMRAKGLTEAESTNYTAKLTIRRTESFNEDLLLAKVTELWTAKNGKKKNPIIKLVPTVDMDALENAIYNGLIDASELASCKVVKETPTLTVKHK